MKREDKVLKHIQAKNIEARLAPYESLNDAAENTGDDGYDKGSTEIWYMHPRFFRDGIAGVQWLKKRNKMPDPKRLKKTHVLLGKISERNPNVIFKMMQGDNWSPDGEAKAFILKKGVRHTSMSVGDIVKVGGKVLIIDTIGFEEID